ncbi:hypothetical protein QZH41_005494 [Actinostola sp. cb2023]|nr:hypothetical protein QZH41_005494 [Actinostola sp. cb2023]
MQVLPEYTFPHLQGYARLIEVGYGIISQQGKEAKHSSIKNDLGLSNRSNKANKTAEKQELPPQLVEIFKPYVCTECGQRFGDQVDLQSHDLLHQDETAVLWSGKNPKEMSVAELKSELKKRNLLRGIKAWF